MHVAFAGGVAFGFELLVEAVEFFAEAAGAGVDAFVAVADDSEAFVAFWAAGVGGLLEAAAVATFAVLADEHFAFLGFDFEHEFAAFRARGAGEVVVAILLVGVFHSANEGRRKLAHVAGESGGFFFASGDGFQAFFPLSGEERRGEVVRNNVDELHAFAGWQEGLSLLFDIEALEELFDDVGAGGWRADAAGFVEHALGVFVVDEGLRIFHGGQQGAFGEAGWRLCLSFADADADAFQGLAFCELWQGAVFAVIFFLLVVVADEVESFPAKVDGDVAVASEVFAVDVEMDAGLFIFVRTKEVGQEALDDKLVNAALVAGQIVLAEAFFRWNDGVVVADLGVVDAAWRDGALFGANETGHVTVAVGCERLQAFWEGGDDVLGEIAGIGARVGEQLVLFVETLHDLQRLLGAEAIARIGVALQGGEVIERWRCGVLFLSVESADGGVLFVAGAHDALANALIAEAGALVFILPEQTHAVHVRLHFVIRLAFEVANGVFALHNHCQRRRLHAAGRKLGVVAAGEGAGDVEAYDPVGFAARLGRAVEVVVLAGWFEMGETLANGLVRLTGNPETAHRFFDVGLFDDPARHQFPFAPSVGGDDDVVDVAALHQAGDGAELLAGLGNHDQIHVLRQNWQRVHAPGFIFFAVMFWVGQRDKMAQGPGDNVFIVFKIAVVLAADAQHAGKLAANGWFFCENERFSHDDPSSLRVFIQYSTGDGCRV